MSYGSETRIYLKSVQNMINVFERWCYRRMLRISWTEHVTNEEVFNMANTKPTLLDGLLKSRLAFYGHLVRKCGITLDLMIGRLHGNRTRGRPITTWLKDLTTQSNISYKKAMTIPRDRKNWRSVGNPRRTPDEWVSEWVSVEFWQSQTLTCLAMCSCIIRDASTCVRIYSVITSCSIHTRAATAFVNIYKNNIHFEIYEKG